MNACYVFFMNIPCVQGVENVRSPGATIAAARYSDYRWRGWGWGRSRVCESDNYAGTHAKVTKVGGVRQESITTRIFSSNSPGWIGFASTSKLCPLARASSSIPEMAGCPENKRTLQLG